MCPVSRPSNGIHDRQARTQFVLALAIVLLAFGLRVYRLDTQSFAFDEGWTSYAIHHTWREIWRVLVPDNHPPLYYVTVKALAEVAGYSDFAVRMLSVLLGTALVAALYALGCALSGPAGGLAAALLAACSPLLIYYAQEARMYSLLMLLVALSSYSLIRLARGGRDLWGLAAYVLTAVGALYTHYFAVLILLAHNLVAAVWLLGDLRNPFSGTRGALRKRVSRAPRALARWVLAQAVIAVLYLPWLPVAIRQAAIGQGTWWRVPLPAKMIAKDTWRFLILGPRRPDVPVAGLALGGMAALVVVALLGVLLDAVLGTRRAGRDPEAPATGATSVARMPFRQPPGATLYAFALWLVPAAAILVASSRELWFALPIYTDRYTLVAAPGLVLVAGVGVATAWRAFSRPDRLQKTCQVFSLLLLGAAVAGPLPHLVHYYDDPAYWREDFRRAAQYAMDTTGPGDAVILVGAYQPVMQYYRGEATVVRFPQQGDSVQDEAAVARALNGAVTPESQVRLIMYSWPTVDPQSLVEGMLRSECRLEGEHWQRETGERPIKVLNLADCTPFAVEPRQPLDAVFGYAASEQPAASEQAAALEQGGEPAGQLALTAYRAIHLQPGEQAHVFLWWRALRRPLHNYSAFVHLVGRDGQIVVQFDHLPLSDFFPMQAWPIGVDYRDDYPLRIPPDADLQGAWLAVGLYDRTSKERLPVYVEGELSGDAVRIPLNVDPADASP